MKKDTFLSSLQKTLLLCFTGIIICFTSGCNVSHTTGDIPSSEMADKEHLKNDPIHDYSTDSSVKQNSNKLYTAAPSENPIPDPSSTPFTVIPDTADDIPDPSGVIHEIPDAIEDITSEIKSDIQEKKNELTN